MISLEYQILIAVLLDQLFGDPRWLPHPVRLIGALSLKAESITRIILPERAAGAATVLIVLGLTGAVTWGLVAGAALIHPGLGDLLAILLLYTTIAARDLAKHGLAVHAALAAGDLAKARGRVAMMVGRDTEELDEEGVAKAAVESVAENLVDGVCAPLFFAALGGPVAAILYKAVNTMDSTFGYKNERYLRFGLVPARLDDLANFLPARLSALLIPPAAFFLGLDAQGAWRMLRRDRLKHASPNSGHSEAAVAGALGIGLGGANFYFGKLVEKPKIGEGKRPVARQDIILTIRLMLMASALSLGLFLGIRWALILA